MTPPWTCDARGHRVHDAADVVHRDDLLDDDLARQRIDLDLREVRAEGLDRELLGIRPARALPDDGVVLELLADLGDRRARALADDVTALHP
jgi:hypothetical protein